MSCSLCRGAGNLFCVQDGTREWWTCQACGGAGVRTVSAPPTLRVHKSNHRPSAKELELVAAENSQEPT